ncbi:MAG: hypothetical protein HYZ35_02565 [Chloroflexi bacterium]|nr:hypothetical protein [Chloroflexota bacterium]
MRHLARHPPGSPGRRRRGRCRGRRPRGARRSSAQVTNYRKEELLGRLVVAVVNFPPRQVGPFKSEVLVLGAINADDTVILLRPDEGAELGSRIA